MFEIWKETGKIRNEEMVIQTKAGNKRWVILNVDSIRNDNGDILYSSSIQVDITELKKSELSLRKSEERHRTILTTMMDGYWLVNIEGLLIEVNETYSTMSGYSETELLGMHISELEAVEDKHHVNEYMRKVISNKKDRFESRHRRKDGTIFDVEVSIQFRSEENGQCVCFLRDITERKMAEDALRDSEKHYRTLVKTINEGIIFQEASGRILSWNKEAERIFGISAEKVIGQTSEEKGWQTIREDGTVYSVKDHPSMVTLRTGEPCRNIIMGVVRPSREVCWISINTSPLVHQHKNHPYAVIISFRDITEIRKANEALSRSKKEIQQTLEATTDGIWSWHFKTNKLFFSPKYYTMLGYEPDQFPADYDSWLHLIHPDDRDKAQAVAEEYVETKSQFYENEFRLRTKAGEYRWIKARARVVEWDENNEAEYLIGHHTDITERKEFELALLDKTAELEQILRAIPDALVYADTDRRIIRVNDSFVKTFGYEPEEVIGKKTEILYASTDDFLQQGKERYNKNLGPSLEPYYLEYRRKNGEVFPTESVGTTVRDNTDRVTGLLGLIRDISHTKQAEQLLLEAKQKYQSMVENIGIGVALINKDLQIVEMNRQLRNWFPNVDTSTALFCYQAFNDSPFDAPCSWCPTSKTLFDGKVHESLTDTPVDGGIRNYRIVSSPIINVKGEVVAAIEMVEDMTERLAFEKQIQQAQRMESIGNLAGGIAHDFNNILFPIIGMAELLLEDLPSGSPERENAEEILRAGMRGSDIVKQILAFSRQSEHQMVPTRIQNILREVLKLSRATIPAYIEIQQDIKNDCGMIRADATQIHQVAMNIITNAYHAMEDKGGKLTVQLSETELNGMDDLHSKLSPGRYAHIMISDTGHGMPPDLIKKIFDPYFTTKEQGKGTGLGLAVVHGIVKEHKGDIKVVSEIGKGSTFNIYLPLMEKPDQLHISSKPKEVEKGHERILLVDDEKPIAKLGKQMLERLGYTVTIRSNSLDALDLFKAKPQSFDLIISDVSMPNMSGDELVTKMKHIRSDVPVILCTGFSERIKDRNINELGINGILMKPIIKSDLAQTVRKVLDEVKFGNQKHS